jgi:transcriptional/translational regulatory protein YebC/TACO1
MQPSNRVEIDESTAGKLMRLIETLEDDDDVNAVHANYDASAEVLERLAAA